MGISNIGNKIMDIADNIAKIPFKEYSGLFKVADEELEQAALKRLEKGLAPMPGFDENAIAGAVSKASSENKNNKAFINKTKELKNAVNNNNLDKATKIAQGLETDYGEKEFINLLNESTQKRQKYLEKYSRNPEKAFKNKTREKLENSKIASNFLSEDKITKASDLAYKANIGLNYFSSNDPTTNAVRAIGVGGGYLVGANVVRGIQGGNPIRNEYGERDIAGIPFI